MRKWLQTVDNSHPYMTVSLDIKERNNMSIMIAPRLLPWHDQGHKKAVLLSCGKRSEFRKAKWLAYFRQNLRDKRKANTPVQSAEVPFSLCLSTDLHICEKNYQRPSKEPTKSKQQPIQFPAVTQAENSLSLYQAERKDLIIWSAIKESPQKSIDLVVWLSQIQTKDCSETTITKLKSQPQKYARRKFSTI